MTTGNQFKVEPKSIRTFFFLSIYIMYRMTMVIIYTNTNLSGADLKLI